MDEIQRREYPSIRGRSRLEDYPALAHSGRAYSSGWEEANWSLESAATHLAGYSVRRRVGASGSISVYNRNLYVETCRKSKIVHLMLDPVAREWEISDDDGRQLGRQAASEISRKRVLNLTVTNRD